MSFKDSHVLLLNLLFPTCIIYRVESLVILVILYTGVCPYIYLSMLIYTKFIDYLPYILQGPPSDMEGGGGRDNMS